MAYKASTFLALILITSILLNTTCQARNSIPKNSNTDEKKEPQWFFHFDGIPGFGRVGSPPLFGSTPQNPYNGGGGQGAGSESGPGPGSAPAGGSYVPGGDDTFIPNPGVEVPIPGSGGVVPVPAAVHP